MILRLEVEDVRDVRGRRALCLLRVTQASARRAHGFSFARQAIRVERMDTELFNKERSSIFGLPEPVVERRESRRQ